MMSIDEEHQKMKEQLVRLVEYLDTLPVQIMIYDDVEADDVIAYLSKQVFSNDNQHKVIVSTDKDFIQLVSDNIVVWNPSKKKVFTKEEVLKEYGIHANNFLLYRVLDGDTSDNVPGVSGVGLKTFVKRFPMVNNEEEMTIDDVIAYSEKNSGKVKIYDVILENRDTMDRNYQLMQLKNVDIAGSIKSMILNRAHEPINTLKKPEFILGLIRDGLEAAFPDPHMWLYSNFLTLNRFATKGEL